MVKKKEKKENKIIKWVKNNYKFIVCFLVGLAIGIVGMFIANGNKTAKLKDGSNVVVSLKGKNITAEDVYDELKEHSGLDAALNLVDDYIVNDYYDGKDKEAMENAKEQAEEIYTSYENYYGLTKEQFLESNNFSDEKEFLEYLANDYLYQLYYDEYTKTLIKDDEVKTYYDNNAFGDYKVYIFSASTSSELDKVKKELKKGTKPSKIDVKNVTKSEETITYKDAANYSDTFIKTMKELKKGKYSEAFNDDRLGSTIIYVTSVAEKAKMDDIKDDILDLIVDNRQAADNTLYYKAFIKIRNDYKIEFKDSKFEKEYSELVKQYK